MGRDQLQTIISAIQNLPLEVLERIPELERIVPKIYETLQIEDVCDHKFKNGQCVCGETQIQA